MLEWFVGDCPSGHRAGLSFPCSSGMSAFPNVPWWGGITHESITNYVNRRHKGDWGPYVGSWQKQFSRLQEIRDKGKGVIVKTTGEEKLRIKLSGLELDAYIENVKKRLAVLRCLARKAERIESTVPTRRSKAKKIAPGSEDKTAESPKIKTTFCARCHGETGVTRTQAIPNLAGQNELYLIKQLKEFRIDPTPEGSEHGSIMRHSRIMKSRVKKLSEEEIWALSAHYAKLPACSKKSAKVPVPPRPKLAAKCVECHGVVGKSVFPDVPNLAGQNRGYLLKQLQAFKATAEGPSRGPKVDSRYHYFMSSIAMSFSDNDLNKLADYFSKLGC